jgi:hypothetical protein
VEVFHEAPSQKVKYFRQRTSKSHWAKWFDARPHPKPNVGLAPLPREREIRLPRSGDLVAPDLRGFMAGRHSTFVTGHSSSPPPPFLSGTNYKKAYGSNHYA